MTNKPKSLIENVRHAYLIGIGGVGMSALARVLKHLGLRVSGSDRKANRTTDQLIREGIGVYIGQQSAFLGDADLVIYSSAISKDHIEMKVAREKGIRIHHRAEILSCVLNRARTSVAVTGTHGKTTTASMIAFVLSELGKNPTCLVGGDVMNLGTNTILGNPDLLVSEVDESDQTHELYYPNYAVVTNLEADHMDHYKDLEALQASFHRFLSGLEDPGVAIYSAEDAMLENLIMSVGKPALSFGFSPLADFAAQNIRINGHGSEFDFIETGFYVTRMQLSVPGMHNISNALAAATLLLQLGLDAEDIARTLVRFRGARRRLEVKLDSPGLTVIDDYAHHPTEVRASIQALKHMGKRLTVIFQPHRYSRTMHFLHEFGRAFDGADELILTDIYGAGEANPAHVGVSSIYDEVRACGRPPVSMMAKDKILTELLSRSGREGIVAFLGAGDIGEIADEFANRFKVPATA